MADPTRRGVLGLLAGGVAAVAVAPTAAFAQRVQYSDLGNVLLNAAADKLNGSTTAEDLKDTVKIDATGISGLTSPDKIEEAFAEAWNDIKDEPYVKELLADARDGDGELFKDLTTEQGRTDVSVPNYIKYAIGEGGAGAAVEASNGALGREYGYLPDRPLQAFFLNVEEQVNTDGYDSLPDLDKLEIYAPQVIDLVQEDWTRGFNQFVENTLKPEIAAAPAPAAAPATVPTIRRKP